MNVLIFSPHPDDDVIGCGGSIAKQVKQGHRVSVVYMTSGESGSITIPKPELANIREQEASEAAAVLGVSETTFFRLPDGYMECGKENIIRTTSLIRFIRSSIVYLPHAADAHRDHRATYEIVTEAVTRAQGPWFQECGSEPWSIDVLLGYEVWTPLQHVSYAEDITDFMDLKITALGKHAVQLKDIKYDEAVRGLNRYRGVLTGRGDYCECFQVLKASRII
jgi:LmbE family N-acetylglucosaminyl deacetylase